MGREFDRLVDGGVLRDVRQERELERAEVQHVPDARLDRVQRDLDERLQERVERAAAADDAEDELRDEPAVLRREVRGREARRRSVRRRRRRASASGAARRPRLAGRSS